MRTGHDGRSGLRASGQALLWTVALLACACSRAPEPPRGDAAPAPAAAGTAERPPAPQVTVSGDERHAVVEVWTPPPVDLPADADLRAVRRQAEAALEDGRLYEDAGAAVPLYLALLQVDPEDAAALRGLARARVPLVEAGRAAP